MCRPRLFLPIVVLCATPCFAQSLQPKSAPPIAKHAPPPAFGPHLYGKEVTLPLELVRGYPFVAGSVNGKVGKLLLDAGEAAALAVNAHAVKVASAIKTGTGFFGSGQTFEVLSLPEVNDLLLPDGLHYTGMTNIRGNSGQQLEQHITADFIGWLGVGFYAGYVMKLDYSKPAVTFYRDDALGSGEQAALRGEQVVQVIRLSPTEHRNLLNFRVKVRGTEYLALLDTGSHVAAWMIEEQITAAKQVGSLREEEKNGTTVLSGLEIDGRLVAPMPVELTKGKPPMATLLPATDDPVITLGYEFLSRYKTVWDYDGMTLTLLAP